MAGKRNETQTREVNSSAKYITIWIGALEDQTDRMTEWEVGFLESVSDQFENGNLTEKQINRLKEIYEKYY
jgi:hypothetical protein